jgi:2-polyprenyl-3-methyl-5-hydroxy-6-metoxy-1,4-benzoquinol methylase
MNGLTYWQEQDDWMQFVEENVGRGAKLLSVSALSSDNRIYEHEGSVFKIRRITPASIRGRLNSLEQEYLILDRLRDIPFLPIPLGYKRTGEWEMLRMAQLDTIPAFDPTFGPPKEKIANFFEVMKFAWCLNRKGCSHGDYHSENVGINNSGDLSVFDFDQSTLGHPLHCLVRDFLGIGNLSRPTDVSLFKRSQNVQYIWPLARAWYQFKRLIRFVLAHFHILNPKQSTEIQFLKVRATLTGNFSIEKLADAWTKAAISNASSPGKVIAYYSLDVGGMNFPGERPWLSRWNTINRNVDFNGKRFLELGCNMGLLAIHAKIQGATACLGIDVDTEVLKAASAASKAFGTEVDFRNLNLDAKRDWESELTGYDIVSALSVMQWVSDRERLWRFLAKQRALLYEGHESPELAKTKLANLGFQHISTLGVSERGRLLIYATKAH